MKWGFVAALALVAVVDACTTTTHARDAPVVPAPMAAGTSAIVSDGKTTFTVRIEQRSTVISAPGRSELVIPARYALPVISAVGTLGGLAQDGRTLPLAPAAHTPTSRFALVDTRLDRAPTFVELPGQFSFDALSQTGTMLYPVQHLQATNSGRYSVRVYDVALRALRPEPIADKQNLEPVTSGYPMARATSRSGTWVFTLYRSTKHPFIHALNVDDAFTVRRDLPRTARHNDTWQLRLGSDGDTLHATHDAVPTTVDVRQLLAEERQ
ncbi:MAG TPA: hypothetical protein VGJ59_11365 [Jatrophihabitantaceae bacterium]|jgi:hypothetical protein